MKNALTLVVVVALGVLGAGCSASAPQPSVVNTAGGATCTYLADGPASKPAQLPPSTGVANTGTVDYVLTINGAKVTVQLDRAAAPCAVNSFVSLADQGFFDNTPCHRMAAAPGAYEMLQCGDPTGTGTGSPGYRFAEELTGTEKYSTGTVAMARTTQPTSQGSQFFLVFGDSQFPPDYTIFGTIDAAGVKALAALAAKGTNNDEGIGFGHPLEPVTITSVKPR